MANVWFTSDTHFGHEKVLTFEQSTRNFANIEEHDEELIRRWNYLVRPKDIVWHLGDVYLGKSVERFTEVMQRLNGSKQLIRGNHDTLPKDAYYDNFDGVFGVWPKYGFVMSHVPLHPDSVERWGLNVHGHLHSKKVTCEKAYYFDDETRTRRQGTDFQAVDERYYCVSVEQHNLSPISLDSIRKHVKERQ